MKCIKLQGMIHLKCLLFITLLLHVTCKPSSTPQLDEVYVYSFVKAQPHDVVGYAQLHFNSKEDMLEPWKMFCSGAFFSKKSVVAPAECAYKFESQELISAGEMFIVRGSRNKMIEGNDVDSSYKFKHNIEKIVVHPDYVYGNYSKSNIGVWILTKEINNEEFGQIHLHLPRSPITKQAFGKLLAFMQPDMPEQNHLVVWKSDLIIYPNSDCNKLVTTDVGLICAGKSHKVEESSSIDVKDKFEYVRAKDIGGMLIIEENLVGVYIRGVYKIVNSERIFYPAIYTDLYAFRDWLLKLDGFANRTIKRNTLKLNKTMIATLPSHVVKRDDVATAEDKPTIIINNEIKVADVTSETENHSNKAKTTIYGGLSTNEHLNQVAKRYIKKVNVVDNIRNEESRTNKPRLKKSPAKSKIEHFQSSSNVTTSNITTEARSNFSNYSEGAPSAPSMENSTPSSAPSNVTTSNITTVGTSVGATSATTATPIGNSTLSSVPSNVTTSNITTVGTSTGTTSATTATSMGNSTLSSASTVGSTSVECVEYTQEEEIPSTGSMQYNTIFLILLSLSFWKIFYISHDIFTYMR